MKRKKPQQVPAAPKPPGWAEKFESAAVAAASFSRSRRLSSWASAFFHPEEAAKQAQEGASVKATAFNLLLFYFGFFLLFFLMLAVSALVLPGSGRPQAINPLSPDFFLRAVILEPVINTIVMLFTLALIHSFAKLLGGTATYAAQSQAISQVFAGWMSLLAFFMVLISGLLLIAAPFSPYTSVGSIISIATGVPALLLLLLSFVVFLWGFYKIYLAIRAAHSLSSLRAAGVLILTVAFLFLLNLLLVQLAGPASA